MNRKALSLLVVFVMALAIVPATSLPSVAASGTNSIHQTTIQQTPIMPVNKQIDKLLNGNEKEVHVIIAPARNKAMEVYKAIEKIGKIDPISKPEYQFIVATIPRKNLGKLKQIGGIIGIWKDHTVRLQKPVVPEAGLSPIHRSLPPIHRPTDTTSNGTMAPNMTFGWWDFGQFVTQAYNVWHDYNDLGDNVTVAVLDTGVDVGQPYLQRTLDGKRKIIDVYDDTDEGIAQLFYETNTTHNGFITVNMTVPVYWGAYYKYYGHKEFTNYTMGTYYVGNISGSEYYLGLLPERYFDFNNFTGYNPYSEGTYGDLRNVYPVLIVNESGNMVAYIDFNLDNNFTDDQPMGLYDLTGDYVQTPKTKVDVAFARVHIGNMNNSENYPVDIPYGAGIGYAMFMWDSFGHGTHVSGTIAGVGLPNDPVFSGDYGMAPDAQLMEVKVLAGQQGFGMDSWIINGMFYAAFHGADVISMSLGGLATYNDGLEDPAIFYANLITAQFGVTFAIAAGNDGPTTNTVGSPGDSDLVITVGAFRSSYLWKTVAQYLYGLPSPVEGVANTVASFSSRGPRMDGLLEPDVIAPGEMIFSSLPLYYTVLDNNSYGYYGIWDGTSMATPHVSGAVALLISYAKAHGLSYNPLMIRRALEMGAMPVEEATPIDQGFGLIQVENSIKILQNLSSQPTTYIYGGTTWTGFRNELGEKKIPLSPAYVEFNSYFYNMGLPYLYRGVYIRNEFPESVPLYFYPMGYYPGYGLDNIPATTYHISSSDSWIIPMASNVVAGNGTLGAFSIQIDYSQLQPGHIYVGFVYIDDPRTSYIDGFIPVIVDMPMNPNGESHATLSDTALPGVAKHYYYQVAPGTKELKVTLQVPLDENGTPMGRTTLMIAKPNGEVAAAYVPGYWFVGPGLPEYTWTIKDPEPGTWEITAYTSTFTKARTGYDESHYTITVETLGITLIPDKIHANMANPGEIQTIVSVKNNNYGTFHAQLSGMGMGRLDSTHVMIRNVNQDAWDVIRVIPVSNDDYYLRVGITQPEDPSADLDLYVFYFPTYEDLMNFTNYTVYTNQIGPTSYESFEKFMPAPGYYLIAVYGYYTAGYNPIHYLFYYQLLGGNSGDITVTPDLIVPNNDIRAAYVGIKIPANGTYLGAIKVKDATTGEVIGCYPIIVQVGLPKMGLTAYAEEPISIGQSTKIKIIAYDPQTMTSITKGTTEFIINGKSYYTDNGVLEFSYTPKSFGDRLIVKAINPDYQDAAAVFTIQELDKNAKFRYYEKLYLEEASMYETLLENASQVLPQRYYLIVSIVTGRYNSLAHWYYNKAESLEGTNLALAEQYMKKAYILEKKANYILQIFIARFGGRD
ncbi:S8 family serine peptidase [Thermococcus sp. Bubb.Bath]|uniref:S8 family serine peptidase n=1 Tax=Thermococcus sp. Bubb.Bath TaxID=1638242 RepID=UPI001439BBDC|nr:S8 family serine peptidase [Thermococcus sp. Bubb.Bath]NJF24160.1 pyrolysin (pls) [Thermococcus sp. Bubb.Bath]